MGYTFSLVSDVEESCFFNEKSKISYEQFLNFTQFHNGILIYFFL